MVGSLQGRPAGDWCPERRAAPRPIPGQWVIISLALVPDRLGDLVTQGTGLAGSMLSLTVVML
jgi:hypothetical protein